MTHSPVPWQRKPGTLAIRDANDNLVANVHCGDRGRRFASTARDNPAKERSEALANAALMRAAPDLLAALVALLAAAEKHIFATECQTERDAARSAIGAAELPL